MRYCVRCVYPENARPTIIFDDDGLCSGCKLHESRPKINWEERLEMLKKILKEYSEKARSHGSPYDCIIPVSGGKDSHFQAYYIKNVLGYNPLLVSYNHGYNTKRGIRNLTNMVQQFNCDLLRFTTNPSAAARISKYMLKKVGDITWHYHAGITTFPIRAAVMTKIPLIVWGEHGFSELLGMYNQDDMLEFSRKDRKEHSMRGFEPEDILDDPENREIKKSDLSQFYYPSDEEIRRIGVKGIFLANYVHWRPREHTRLMIEKFNFETSPGPRERTYHTYDKLDDIHANGTHDYLKFLKFGYGRATDDASHDIRHRRMTREEGIEMVRRHDHVRPSDLDIFLRFTGMTEQEFLDIMEPLRDPQIWEKNGQEWVRRDSVVNHINDPGVEKARLQLGGDREMIRSYNQPKHCHGRGQCAGRDGGPEDTEYVWL